MSEKPLKLWYEKGLSFKCTECGGCCGKEPGYVWLKDTDIEKMAARLDVSKEFFLKTYARFVSGRYSLIEKPNYDCIFLENNRCSIYESRPKQCREFPFWQSNLDSEMNWNMAALDCEGINHKDAKNLSLEEIQAWRNS
jgi:Fe-S-cluster containining protein